MLNVQSAFDRARLPLSAFLGHARGVGPFRQGKPFLLPTPELDAYEKELRARSHRKVTYAGIACILLVMPLIVLVGMATIPDMLYRVRNPLHGLSAPTRAKVTTTVARAREESAREEALMHEGVASAIREGIEAHPELGRCPYSHSPNLQKESFFAASTFTNATDPTLCRACRSLASDADTLEKMLSEKTREKDFDARAEKRIDRLTMDRYTVVVHATRNVAPSGVPHVDFTPGFFRGRAFVWDTRAHQVVCAGDVSAESSDVIDYTYTTRGGLDIGSHAELDRALKSDMRVRTESAVADSIRYRSGPRIPD